MNRILLLAMASALPALASAAAPEVGVKLNLGANMMNARHALYEVDADGKKTNDDIKESKASKAGFAFGLGLQSLWNCGGARLGPALEVSHGGGTLKKSEKDESYTKKTYYTTTLKSGWGLGFYGVFGLGEEAAPAGLMPYVKLGVAGKQFKPSYKSTVDGKIDEKNKLKSTWKWGFSAGAGVEKKFGDISVSLEYNYTGFGDVKSAFKDENSRDMRADFKKIRSHKVTLGIGTTF